MASAEQIVRALEGRWNGHGGMCRCPAHEDRTPSLSVTQGDGQVLVHCHAGCTQEVVLEALAARGLDIRQLDGVNRATHIDEYRHPRLGKPSHTWPYHDAEGRMVGYVARFETANGKTFRPLMLEGGCWRAGGLPQPYPLFNLPGILARPDAPVLVCEGEKAAEAASKLFPDMVATTPMHGAQSPHKTDWSPLEGRDVTIWPDADEPGAGFASHVAQLARKAGAASVRIVQLPDTLPKGWDLADEPPAGMDLAALLAGARKYNATEDADSSETAIMTLLSEVAPEPVRWLWPGRIPLGKLTILDGDPGLGKSTLTLDLAARVTTGRQMPDGADGLTDPAGVVLLSCEDDLADTVRPRLDAAEADVSRIVHLSGVKDAEGTRLPTIANLPALQQAIDAVDARLVVIDPLMAHLPSGTDSHRDQDIRGSLAPLAEFAARTKVTVLIVRHLNKSGGGNPLYRGGGSIGIIAAMRSALLVAPDPDEEDKCVLAQTKANLAEPMPALSYAVVEQDDVGRIVWHGDSEHDAAALLTHPTDSERSAVKEAESFLREVLAAGPVATKDVEREAREAGITKPTLRRAKQNLEIKARKLGQPGSSGQAWQWVLPE